MFRLLLVTAHPDDEAGSFGGTLAKLSDQGVEICITCLTPGQAATHRGGAASDEELSAMRRKEFEKSCRHLGAKHCELLNHPDGKLDRTDFYEVASFVTRRIREFRPQVVLTYGPDGSVTGHNDHGMAGLFATAAFQWAPRAKRCPEQLAEGLSVHQPQKLYYLSASFTIPDRPAVALAPVTACLDVSKYQKRKFEAFQMHSSQEPLFEVFQRYEKNTKGFERYHLAASHPIRAMKMEEDLFDGVTDEEVR